VNVQLFLECAVVVSNSSENVTLQGGFLFTEIAGGRKCAMDVNAVGSRASGGRACCEPIMMLMLVVIGTVIPWSSPLLRTAVLRSIHTR
jgi:hypothetical protein